MNSETILSLKNIEKTYKSFNLNISNLEIPRGFATALIGENGAGKTTLIKILTGLITDYNGDITYFNGETNQNILRESIGYTSSTSYFLPVWTTNTIKAVSPLLYETFSADEFDTLCQRLELWDDNTEVANMSDGMRMKTELASVFARDTRMLILDEPASPLDPLAREKLNTLIREYLSIGDGEKSVFFSTHNISDMERVTDYAIIMAKGAIVEAGFVEDLKEKYLLVKGDARDTDKLSNILISINKGKYTCEGLCEASDLDKLAGFDVEVEIPTLSQISVGIMRKHSSLQFN